MQRLRAQSLEIAEDVKQGLLSADRDKKVAKLVDHLLDKGMRLKEIKGSDALGAMKMYADRRWPVRTESAPPSRTFIQTNLNIFLPDSQPTPQDAPIDTTCSVLEDGKETREGNLNQFNTCNVRL
jgi:hypothetical protein